MTIPIGSLCVVVPPAILCVGDFVTVVEHLTNQCCRDRFGDIWVAEFAYGLSNGTVVQESSLRIIRPPRSASPVMTNTKHDEPVSA